MVRTAGRKGHGFPPRGFRRSAAPWTPGGRPVRPISDFPSVKQGHCAAHATVCGSVPAATGDADGCHGMRHVQLVTGLTSAGAWPRGPPGGGAAPSSPTSPTAWSPWHVAFRGPRSCLVCLVSCCGCEQPRSRDWPLPKSPRGMWPSGKAVAGLLRSGRGWPVPPPPRSAARAPPPLASLLMSAAGGEAL